MVNIVTVGTEKQLKEFISFPTKLYKKVWQAVPDLYSEEKAYLTQKTNPAYDYCETKLFLAVENGRTVGRIAAILNNKYNEKTGENRMRFSRFDVEDNAEAAAKLLGAVEAFAREKGMNRVHGPIGFSDLDKQGMLVEGYELLDTSITLYNHPYYNTFMEQNGYGKEADWIEFLLEANEETTSRMARISERVLKMNGSRLLKIRKFKDIEPRVNEIFDLLNTCYMALYGTTPLSKQMQDYYVKQYFKMLNFDYVSVCVDKDDKIAAFALAFPSLAKAFKKSNGKLFPFGFIRMLRAMKKTDTLELALIAVRPDLQGKGLNAVVCNEVIQRGVRNGVVRAETGPMLETNDKIQSQWLKVFEGHYTQHKRRRCYATNL
jgi:GNAT superfamily N-acetyltransferase